MQLHVLLLSNNLKKLGGGGGVSTNIITLGTANAKASPGIEQKSYEIQSIPNLYPMRRRALVGEDYIDFDPLLKRVPRARCFKHCRTTGAAKLAFLYNRLPNACSKHNQTTPSSPYFCISFMGLIVTQPHYEEAGCAAACQR